ncbi:MAG: hypothetical protein WA755_01260 [Candidatus Acidiferrales bacterium]
MNRALVGLGVTTLLAFLMVAAPIQAQTTTQKRTPVRYDVSKETTTKATVQQIVVKPSHGAMPETHLVLATSKGTLNAQLGPSGTQGPRGVKVTPGESVTVVGETLTGKHGSVYVARTIQTSERLYTIRNKNGALLVDPTKATDGNPPAGHIRSAKSGGAR